MAAVDQGTSVPVTPIPGYNEPGVQASSADFIILRQLSTDGGSNDDGGRNRLDARRTSRMKAPHSSRSRSMGTVDNTHTDIHIHNQGSHSRTHPGTQIR